MALSSHVCTLCSAETFFRHCSTEVETLKKREESAQPMDFRLATILKITQNFSPCRGTSPPAPLSRSSTATSFISHGVSQPRPLGRWRGLRDDACSALLPAVLPLTPRLIPCCRVAAGQRSCSHLPEAFGAKAAAV